LADPSLAGQKAEINGNLSFLLAHGWTRGARHYAYPGGQYNNTSLQALAQLGMLTARTDDIARIQANAIDERYLLAALGVYNSTSVASLETYVNQAIDENSAAMIFFHYLVPSNANVSTQYLDSNFETFIDWLNTQCNVSNLCDVVTISQWYNGLNQ
jgi:hypothetical protein